MSQIFIFYILSQFSKCCILIIINFRQNGPPPPLLSTSVLKTGFVFFVDIHAFLYICKKIISLLEPQISQHNAHCLKIVQYGVISGPYFPVFELNTESECAKIRTRNYSVFGHFTQWLNIRLIFS